MCISKKIVVIRGIGGFVLLGERIKNPVHVS